MTRTKEEMEELLPTLQEYCSINKSLTLSLRVDDEGKPYILIHCVRYHGNGNGATGAQLHYLKSLCRYKSNRNIGFANKWAASRVIDMVKTHDIERSQVYFRC